MVSSSCVRPLQRFSKRATNPFAFSLPLNFGSAMFLSLIGLCCRCACCFNAELLVLKLDKGVAVTSPLGEDGVFCAAWCHPG